jgi:antitoxin (DNA-binding transcriptional repressor) of toxin-antitoxin stability system
MHQVNIFQAKTELSRIIALLENKNEDCIIIARNGKPVARLVPIGDKDVTMRIGAARGLFKVPEDLDEDNPVIAGLFGADE